MNSEIGQASGRNANGTRKRRSYDDLAGSAVLRRAGKAAALEAPQRGDAAATLLAARLRSEPDDRVGRELKSFYQGLLREPVPARFQQLVNDLESSLVA